jgi:hypothetical protein
VKYKITEFVARSGASKLWPEIFHLSLLLKKSIFNGEEMLRVLSFIFLSGISTQALSQEIAIEGELSIRNQCTVIEKLEQSAMLTCPGGITTRRLFNSNGDQFIVQKKIGDDFLVADSKGKLQLYDKITADGPQTKEIPTGNIQKVEKSKVKTSIYFSLNSYQKNKWENDAAEVPNKLTFEDDKIRTLPLDFLVDFKFNEKLLLSLNPRFSNDGGEVSFYFGFGDIWLGGFADAQASKEKVTIELPNGAINSDEADTIGVYTGASLRYYHTSDTWNVLTKLNVGYYKEELDSNAANEELSIDALMIKGDLLVHHMINKNFAM